MKNFLEATDIKPKLTPHIELMLTPVEQCVCVATINGQVVPDGPINSYHSILVKDYPIDSPIEIKILTQRVHPQAVRVEVVIDGYNIIPKYQHLAIPPTDYLDFNGEWILTIPNFYPWYHEISGQGWIA